MAQIRWIDLLLRLFVLLALFICDCVSKPLDGYKFPVYTTESCPRNQIEWSERSSAINCTESNGYLCLPNEDLTELLEFCYFDHRILIEKGVCMFLRKRDSIIDDYSCRNFVEGCPNSTYRVYEVYKYRSCVSIGKSCFRAEPACIRTTATYHLSTTLGMTTSVEETNNTMHEYIPLQERNDWVWILTLLCVGALICVPVIMFCFKKMKSKGTKTRRIKKYGSSDKEKNAERNNRKNEIASQKENDNSDEDDTLHKENITGRKKLNCVNRRSNDIQLSFKNGSNTNLCSSKGFSPHAIASDNIDENTKLIIENSANVNSFEKIEPSSLHMACQNGHDNIVKMLIEKGADVNLCSSKVVSPLTIASGNGHESTVQLLIGNGAHVNLLEENGSSPLYMACQNGHDNIVKILIEKGAKVDLCCSKGVSPLTIASYIGYESIVQLLIENGANVNSFEKIEPSPLYMACQNGHDNIVKILIEKGADVNLCSSKVVSPLTIASGNGYESTVQLLIENGAHVNLLEKNGSSPLYMACQNGHGNIVKILIEEGADVNLCSSDGVSPLKIASHKGYEKIVKLLLVNSACVN